MVFDIDGVLSDATKRQHFLDGDGRKDGRKDWRGFFDACGDDELIVETGRLTELLDPAVAVVLLTGRPVRVRQLTVDWLDGNGVRWDLLVMRDAGDYSAALEFKRRTVAQLRARGLDLRLAFEDDERNHRMFLDEGVPCMYIHSGYYGQAGAAARSTGV